MEEIKDTRYIVVLMYQGIGYTLLNDGGLHLFFHYFPKMYKKIGNAINSARKAERKWLNDKVCVFKVSTDESLSCDIYRKWMSDKDRLVWCGE